MATANHIAAWLNLVAYVALGVVAFRQWQLRRDRASLWAATAFGTLGVIVLLGRVLGNEPGTLAERALERILIAGLVLFPYLLYRFMRTFAAQRALVDRAVIPLTVALVLATFVLPEFPDEEASWPWWFTAYLVAFLVHWTLLSVLVTARLWAAGSGQPSVARRRMRGLGLASAALTFAILFVAFAGGDESAAALVTQLAALFSALAFMLGLAPPASVRAAWRQPEQERFGDAVATLMSATTAQEVAAAVLPALARFVGADAVVLRNEVGGTIGSFGAAAGSEDGATIVLPVAGGSLALWASPYAPYFGDEELRLAESLAALTSLALDRTRLFAYEREARTALERADELKSQFVALAAHELRAPVAALFATVDTLDRLAERLDEAERTQLRTLLRSQVERLRALTEQLLDLSRLEAHAIDLKPIPIRVREHVDMLAQSIVGGSDVLDVLVDPGLEATVDPEAFDRIVANLIGNAVRHGEPPVLIRAEQRDRHFRVVVEDRGPGVPREFEPLLFERFARSGSSKERGEGTGLGLAIARSYARAHGGDLIYQPADPHGAHFELVLPR